MSSTPHHLPNFFIVGAPKAGTTSLYHYLAQHPDIYMSPIKEPCHFSAEIRPGNFNQEMRPGIESAMRAQRDFLQGPMSERRPGAIGMEWDDYLKLFKNVKGEKAIGEASVVYLWSKTAAENIHRKIPNARILMMLRDPVQRAFSEYLEAITAGALRCSFCKYVEACMSYHENKLSLFWPVLEYGLYYESVKRYLDKFPRENVRIFLYDDYQAEPAQILAEIFRFVSVDPSFVPDLTKRYNLPQVPRFIAVSRFLKKYGMWQHAGKLFPPGFRSLLKKLAIRPRGSVTMTPADRQFLLNYYRDDIQRLAGLLNRDLSAWLS